MGLYNLNDIDDEDAYLDETDKDVDIEGDDDDGADEAEAEED